MQINIHIHTHIHLHKHKHIHKHIHIHKHKHIHIHKHIHEHVHVHILIRTYIQKQIHTYVHRTGMTKSSRASQFSRPFHPGSSVLMLEDNSSFASKISSMSIFGAWTDTLIEGVNHQDWELKVAAKLNPMIMFERGQ